MSLAESMISVMKSATILGVSPKRATTMNCASTLGAVSSPSLPSLLLSSSN